jgi:UrcA family protein
MHRTFLLAAVGACISVVASAPAHARAEDRIEVRIAYGDLDLTHPAGMAAFEARVRQIAAEACSAGLESSAINRHQIVRACMRDIQAKAMSELATRRPRVASAY